jgi:acyl phosphate:glycerol-3-phosphate acyltransferase
VRWRGSFETATDDVSYDAIEIGSHILGSDTDGLDPLLCRPIISAGVAHRIVTKVVSNSIDLNGYASGLAKKVEHERSKGVLSPELQAVRLLPKRSPESDLRRAHAFAKLTCLVDSQCENPSTMLRMVPLPAQSRGGCVARPLWFATHQSMTREMLLALALGYLLGSIPFGLLLTRLAGKGDIRDIGSGNIGATNVLRTGSRPLAALTLILDCVKATAAILLARDVLGDESAVLAATGAMVGHLYPVWLRFRGGKGVATLLGVLIPLLPIAAAIYAAIWLLLLLTSRISSVAGMTAVISAPVMALVLHSSYFPMLLGFGVLVLWKHRANILRLTKGTEPRIGTKTSSIA